ncbi:low affinity immunoglobulin gamma Fc region receptor II-b-like [Anabas testudineus]|uniref:Ig-like domain-containing protein n=1 Tax=Anabas testudineus TaxID=64144 RepID=A0A3Q1GX53_ANATE|nr:low affinity immunoglobulin gamma Fc region receptor II-b-like [Anabas testudineus]
MEVTALCFKLLMLGFLLLEKTVQAHKSGTVVLRIIPNRQQHFEYEPVSFYCESNIGSTQIKGIKNAKEFYPACHSEKPPTGSSCMFDKVYAGDSGGYWCETKQGERSNTLNISVTGGSVILESPALPVFEGENVTLRCIKKANSSKLTHFYKNDFPVQISPAEEMRIDNVSKSNEGLYSCSISDGGTSPGSWLVLRGNSFNSTPPHGAPISDDLNVLVVNLLRIAIIIFVVAVLLLILSKSEILVLKSCRA